MKHQLVFVASVVVVVGSGCADARITGTLGDRTVRATGTVAAWLDTTLFVDQGDGSATREDRSTDASTLHIELFEPAFDAAVDFGALSAGERTALVDEISRGDRISVVVRRGEALRAGDDIASLPSQGLPPEVLPFVDGIAIALREPAVDGASYPEEVARPGSEIEAEFAIDQTTPILSGTLSIDVAAADDEGEALEGTLVIEFATELLPERIAECNFDRFGQGAVDACTLAPFSAGQPGLGGGAIGGGGGRSPDDGAVGEGTVGEGEGES